MARVDAGVDHADRPARPAAVEVAGPVDQSELPATTPFAAAPLQPVAMIEIDRASRHEAAELGRRCLGRHARRRAQAGHPQFEAEETQGIPHPEAARLEKRELRCRQIGNHYAVAGPEGVAALALGPLREETVGGRRVALLARLLPFLVLLFAVSAVVVPVVRAVVVLAVTARVFSAVVVPVTPVVAVAVPAIVSAVAVSVVAAVTVPVVVSVVAAAAVVTAVIISVVVAPVVVVRPCRLRERTGARRKPGAGGEAEDQQRRQQERQARPRRVAVRSALHGFSHRRSRGGSRTGWDAAAPARIRPV